MTIAVSLFVWSLVGVVASGHFVFRDLWLLPVVDTVRTEL